MVGRGTVVSLPTVNNPTVSLMASLATGTARMHPDRSITARSSPRRIIVWRTVLQAQPPECSVGVFWRTRGIIFVCILCLSLAFGVRWLLTYCPDDNFEENKDKFEDNVEDFPEDAARWTGEKVCTISPSRLLPIRRTDTDRCSQVGEAEEIPENIEQGWDRAEDRVETGFDNAVDNVEDFPENTAEWFGEKVGAVEQFGDDLDDAYDEGRDEGRDDDYGDDD